MANIKLIYTVCVSLVACCWWAAAAAAAAAKAADVGTNGGGDDDFRWCPDEGVVAEVEIEVGRELPCWLKDIKLEDKVVWVLVEEEEEGVELRDWRLVKEIGGLESSLIASWSWSEIK